jgi:hypothetical protein
MRPARSSCPLILALKTSTSLSPASASATATASCELCTNVYTPPAGTADRSPCDTMIVLRRRGRHDLESVQFWSKNPSTSTA